MYFMAKYIIWFDLIWCLPYNVLHQVARLLGQFYQSLVPSGQVHVFDQACDDLPDQVPSLLAARPKDVVTCLID